MIKGWRNALGQGYLGSGVAELVRSSNPGNVSGWDRRINSGGVEVEIVNDL